MKPTITLNILLCDDDAVDVLVQIGRMLAESRIAERRAQPPWIATVGDERIEVNCRAISSPEQAEALFTPPAVELAGFDIVLLDNDWEKAARNFRFGLEMLRRVKWQRGRGSILAIFTAANTFRPDFISEALTLGAEALINKNEPTHFLNLLLSAVDRKKRRLEEERWRQLGGALAEKDPAFASSSPLMQRVLRDVAMLAPWRNESVLLLGAVGTGKTRLAAALHKCSPRASGPFVTLDPGTVQDSLLHAELFGVERGAFTDARTRKGRIEIAQGGTLFIDELENMSERMQEALLRVLENHSYTRPGDPTEHPVDVRFFFATNQDPLELVRSGKLRQDLYSRIDQNIVRLPPLAERIEDIPLLTSTFIEEFYAENLPEAARPCLHEDALQVLRTHAWPHNLRDLKNTVRRSLLRLPPSADLHAKDILFNQQPGMVAKLSTEDMGKLLELAPRQGQQRKVFDLLVERAPEAVDNKALNKLLEQPDSETASDTLMTTISRLRKRIEPLGFDIREDREQHTYMLVKSVEHA
jgi:DNA-binding NtrC family response regulator